MAKTTATVAAPLTAAPVAVSPFQQVQDALMAAIVANDIPKMTALTAIMNSMKSAVADASAPKQRVRKPKPFHFHVWNAESNDWDEVTGDAIKTATHIRRGDRKRQKISEIFEYASELTRLGFTPSVS